MRLPGSQRIATNRILIASGRCATCRSSRERDAGVGENLCKAQRTKPTAEFCEDLASRIDIRRAARVEV